MNIGERIKDIRKKKKLTLSDISQRTGISSSSLSRMENTTLSLNYDKLQKIANALEADIVDIVAPDNAQNSDKGVQSNPLARCSVELKKDNHFVDEDDGLTCYLFSDLKKKNMDVELIELKPIAIKETEFVKHPGEKTVYVLEGRVEIHLEYYTPKILEAGDSIYFDSDMWHSATARDGKPAKILVVCSINTGADTAPEIMMGRIFMDNNSNST
jgi:transcriptional regulator with XRE-family HTH domain